jgi:hypothetical protein
MSSVLWLVLVFALTITPLHVLAQGVFQTEIPLDKGGPIATLSRLQEVFIKRQGQLQSDAKTAGNIMASFPNGDTVTAVAFTNPTTGASGVLLMCGGSSQEQAKALCQSFKQ